MKRASLMYELGNTGNRADWPSFRDTLAQNPHHLVLALPVRRRDGEVRLGFDGMPDWRSLSELVNTLRSVDSLRTLSLITVAAEPGRDTYRGVAAAAQHFAYRLAKPVIYSCHRTEYCAAVAAFNKNELQTFPGLLIGALAHGKPLDRAFCYARNRSMLHVDEPMLAAFGVPGYYVERSTAERSAVERGEPSAARPISPAAGRAARRRTREHQRSNGHGGAGRCAGRAAGPARAGRGGAARRPGRAR